MHLSHMQQSYPAHVQNVGNEKFLPFLLASGSPRRQTRSGRWNEGRIFPVMLALRPATDVIIRKIDPDRRSLTITPRARRQCRCWLPPCPSVACFQHMDGFQSCSGRQWRTARRECR